MVAGLAVDEWSRPFARLGESTFGANPYYDA